MRKSLKLLALTAAYWIIAVAPASANLIGTQVTGSLWLSGTQVNYYDPISGFVIGSGRPPPFAGGIFPGGSLNAGGTTVTISDPGIEFGYHDNHATVSAEFTGSQLIISHQFIGTARYVNWTMIFTAPAFTSLFEVSDTFGYGGVTGSLAGNVLTFSWSGGQLDSGIGQAVFNVGPVPVPDGGSTLLMLSLAGLRQGRAGWRRGCRPASSWCRRQ